MIATQHNHHSMGADISGGHTELTFNLSVSSSLLASAVPLRLLAEVPAAPITICQSRVLYLIKPHLLRRSARQTECSECNDTLVHTRCISGSCVLINFGKIISRINGKNIVNTCNVNAQSIPDFAKFVSKTHQ